MAAALCCSYKTSRRGLLLATMLTFIFSIVFLGVGSVSVRFGGLPLSLFGHQPLVP